MTPEALATLLHDRAKGHPGRFMVAIAGPPASGKTTLAADLARALGHGARVVPMDGFHLANSELLRLGRSGRKGAPDTFDAAGYASLLRRIQQQSERETVYAPDFRRDLEEAVAGAIAVLLETIPQEVAKIVYEKLTVPFLGTGVGPYSDAPMINIYDMLGYTEKVPKFVKKYADVRAASVAGAKQFVKEVKDGTYPGPEHCYKMADGEFEKLDELIKKEGI